HYWSTSQYWPKFAPVIINGIMYSTWYTATTGYSNGVMATDLYTGKTLWVVNTTNALRCGMVTEWKTINAYGCIGPYIWTTGTLPAADTGGTLIANQGTQWNMYDALTGKYVLSVVNGTTPVWTTDEHGHMIGYYINSTVGTMTTYGNPPQQTGFPQPVTGYVNIKAGAPVLVCFNMSQALAYNPSGRSQSWGWAPAQNTVIDWGRGVMWAVPVYNNISGVPINPPLAINGITDNAVIMTAGFVYGQGTGGEMAGWLVVAAQDATTGAYLWAKNLTYTDTDVLAPFTRIQMQIQDGLWIIANMGYNWHVQAFNARTGTTAWKNTLEGFNGAQPNHYDVFNLKSWSGPGVIYYLGFGGDLWCFNVTTGKQLWYTNTTALIGSPGIETPYNIWPLWVFNCACMTNDVAYFAIGHEYNPPLFHGAQLLALNVTDGSLIWKELDMSVESTSIAYGILLSRNCYDNMIYAFGKGPSAVTVTAPDVGVTTATPVTIRGTVMDVSPGTKYLAQPDVTMTKQNEVALRFPNGVPCVSDESQSAWMEYVYQQQPLPTNTTGVLITIDVIDSNNNYRTIGTTTSDTTGSFSFTWTPDIPGDFTVIATFAGSNS
ncbi:MAG: PQQ-binding-like beta-propeller repeat protein, partial [Candidatus Bathyarchaeota archaeon]|nr:PQQ-binding-like beta-propeller repeat protein [Candidatus Bathyarchaeota archaeon]